MFCEQNVEFKILVMLDNAPAHPSTETLKSTGGEVATMFLPPNTTSVVQPRDGNFGSTEEKVQEEPFMAPLY